MISSCTLPQTVHLAFFIATFMMILTTQPSIPVLSSALIEHLFNIFSFYFAIQNFQFVNSVSFLCYSITPTACLLSACILIALLLWHSFCGTTLQFSLSPFMLSVMLLYARISQWVCLWNAMSIFSAEILMESPSSSWSLVSIGIFMIKTGLCQSMSLLF